jgi:small subunit ribosomal protein S20
MPNTKQAKKRVNQDEKKRETNKVIKTQMRTAMRRVINAATSELATEGMPAAMKRIDKAAKSNIIHANAAARYKSRLHRIAASK